MTANFSMGGAESSNPTQHAKGRRVTVQGPVKKQQPGGMPPPPSVGRARTSPRF